MQPKQVFEKQKKVQYSRSALGRPRKHPKVDPGDGDADPAPKKRGRPKKVAKQADNTPTSSEEVVPRIPKKRGRPKKVATVSLDMEGSVKRSGSVDEEEVVPPKKRGRPKKVASITTEVVSERDSPGENNSDEDNQEGSGPDEVVAKVKEEVVTPEKAKKRRGRPKA